MAERCAVVGIGQTHHRKVRDDVSLAGLATTMCFVATSTSRTGMR